MGAPFLPANTKARFMKLFQSQKADRQPQQEVRIHSWKFKRWVPKNLGYSSAVHSIPTPVRQKQADFEFYAVLAIQ